MFIGVVAEGQTQGVEVVDMDMEVRTMEHRVCVALKVDQVLLLSKSIYQSPPPAHLVNTFPTSSFAAHAPTPLSLDTTHPAEHQVQIVSLLAMLAITWTHPPAAVLAPTQVPQDTTHPVELPAQIV